MGFRAVVCFRGLECSVIQSLLLVLYSGRCPDSPSFQCLLSLAWVGGSGVVEGALKDLPSPDLLFTQRPCCIENGAVNFVHLVFASSDYGRGECVRPYAIVRSAANRFGK